MNVCINIRSAKTPVHSVVPPAISSPSCEGFPRFVSGSSYAEAFGEQWKRYRKTQLDSYTKTTISRDRLRRCLGEETWHCLKRKHVLECGCGAGRFTKILLAQGACVTSIDLSKAVDANAENCPPSATHRIAQADIEALPFLPHGFDVVLCLGVIHTPNPERTIAHLAQQVKPGCAFEPYFSGDVLRVCIPSTLTVATARMALLDTHHSLTDSYRHFRPSDKFIAPLSAQA
jgi:2-polyprenyl-3-methyl-5-hydroxy-6-metoxy-1,4-benzoquinol methylase